MTQPAGLKAAVIYYSATGSVYALAKEFERVATEAGAEVRLRKAQELAPEEAIKSNEGWAAHALETQDVQVASTDDLLWADVIFFGTPTRFGNVSAQLKQLIDACGPLWAKGQLTDKVVSGFTSIATSHGGHEATLLALYNTMYHWGSIVVAPGYTDPVQFAAGNPYGVSHTSNNGQNPPGETELASVGVAAKRALRIAAALKAAA